MSTTTKVKERPILFSGPMVRAILDGCKTQTRRVLKPQPTEKPDGRWSWIASSSERGEQGKFQYSWPDPDGNAFTIRGREQAVRVRCPYGSVGDRLWVRESHAIYKDAFVREKGEEVILYRADASAYWNMTPHDHIEAEFNPLRDSSDYEPKWTPSIHMPRWASRITLEITGVRVERLNAISEEDAKTEGIHNFGGGLGLFGYDPEGTPGPMVGGSAVEAFALLWESINGPGSWSANPWVWVIEFKRSSGD